MQIVANTATEAWEEAYEFLKQEVGESHNSRAGEVVGEVLNAMFVIQDPRNSFVDSPTRKLSIKYAVGELMWYLSGSNSVKQISQYGKFWDTLSDDEETVNSAYGHRIYHKFGFDQWEYIKMMLTKDSYSRQAIVHIKDPSQKATKDTPCTVALQYQIRENKLYATTFMRSNDIWLGVPYDFFAFMSLQVKLAMELSVELGEYTHIAGSLHLYKKDSDAYINKLKQSKKTAVVVEPPDFIPQYVVSEKGTWDE